MSKTPKPVNSLDEVTLIAVRQLGAANGQTVSDEVEKIYPKTHFATVYSALERMTLLGYLATKQGESMPVPGGRARKYYTITARGREVLALMDEIRARAKAIEAFKTPATAFNG